MKLLFGILFQLSLLLEVQAAPKCVSAAEKLSKLLEEANKDELIASLLDDIEKAKPHMRKLSHLDDEIEIAEKAGDIAKVKQLNAEVKEVQKVILAMNNDFMEKTAVLFEEQGISHILYEDNGQLIIKLNLEGLTTDNRALKFYERAKRLFGVDKVTISFGENAAYQRKGFFRRTEKRVELGYKEILNLIDGDMGVTPRHEFRHANFAYKEASRTQSAYQMRFKSSKNGKLLNEFKSYDKYMSAEEVYNWSTDFQTLSKKLRDSTPEKEAQILKDITNKTDGAVSVTTTAGEVSESVIKHIQEAIDQKLFTRINIPDDNLLLLEDSYGRTVEIGFYGPEREKLLEKARALNEELASKSDDYANPLLEKHGFTDSKSQEYKLARRKYLKEFLASDDGKHVVTEFQKVKKQIAEEALSQLKLMKLVANEQLKQVKILGGFLDKLAEGDPAKKPILLKAIREKMKLIGDNVKEGYNGSLLKKHATSISGSLP